MKRTTNRRCQWYDYADAQQCLVHPGIVHPVQRYDIALAESEFQYY